MAGLPLKDGTSGWLRNRPGPDGLGIYELMYRDPDNIQIVLTAPHSYTHRDKLGSGSGKEVAIRARSLMIE